MTTLAVQDTVTTVTLDPLFVALLAGTLIPVATGIATKLSASSGVKAIVALVLSAAVGLGSEIVAGGGTFEVKVAVAGFVGALVTNVAAYAGVYKPVLGAPPLARSTSGFGIGTPVEE